MQNVSDYCSIKLLGGVWIFRNRRESCEKFTHEPGFGQTMQPLSTSHPFLYNTTEGFELEIRTKTITFEPYKALSVVTLDWKQVFVSFMVGFFSKLSLARVLLSAGSAEELRADIYLSSYASCIVSTIWDVRASLVISEVKLLRGMSEHFVFP